MTPTLPSVVARLRTRIGQSGTPSQATVEASHVRRFAEAIGDCNPRWLIQAPPTFLVAIAPGPEDIVDLADEAERYGMNWLNGGNRFEYVRPLMVGDQVVFTGALTDVYVKEGSKGALLFIVFQTNFTDQSGSLIARLYATAIRL
jgi:hypothetical protein